MKRGILADCLYIHDIFNPAVNDRGELFKVLFSEKHPEFRAVLKTRVRQLLEGPYSETAFNRLVDQLEQRARAGVLPQVMSP